MNAINQQIEEVKEIIQGMTKHKASEQRIASFRAILETLVAFDENRLSGAFDIDAQLQTADNEYKRRLQRLGKLTTERVNEGLLNWQQKKIRLMKNIYKTLEKYKSQYITCDLQFAE